ncbi:MAG TPA: hypothetical protein VFT66_20555 [Roseiflexaceae bacterium]|jgi:hypothetical protein|nr:hypothetical protein [Roseiflexaceae bacterium]
MVTVEDIIEYLTRIIAEDRLSGNRVGLLNSQRAAGFLMTAANANGDKQTAQRFRLLAAEAANKNEELDRNRD